MPRYPATPLHVRQRQAMHEYTHTHPLRPGFPMRAFPPSFPIDYQIMNTVPPWAQLLVSEVGEIKMRMQKQDQIERAVFDTRNALKYVEKYMSDLKLSQ